MDSFCTELSRASVLPHASLPSSSKLYDVDAAPVALWLGLLSGNLTVVSCESRATSVVLSLRSRRAPLDAPPPSALARAAFDAAVRGTSQKVVALQARSSPSAIAGRLRQVTHAMGLRCNFKQVPLGIPLLAHSVGHPQLVEYYWGERSRDGAAAFLICLKRCDDALDFALSPGELTVARMLLDGYTHHEIAARRETSIRTVANQISSLYRKVGTSGRFELIRRLVDDASRLGAPALRRGVMPHWATQAALSPQA